METERIEYGQWTSAYRCRHRDAELIVVAQIGPRILSLRWKRSANLLYEDETGLTVGDWRLYGGHRFTVAPEGPESYAPDNSVCLVERTGQELRITAPPHTNGTRRSLIISAAGDGVGFDLRHVLQNDGPDPWRGALWAITCVPPARALAPIAASTIRFWPGTNKSGWDAASSYIVGRPSVTRGKIGGHSSAAFLVSFQPEATLVIHNPNPPALAECPQSQCNLEMFSCLEYLELETLGPGLVILPGDHAIHHQRWRLLEAGLDPREWRRIATLAGCDLERLVAHDA